MSFFHTDPVPKQKRSSMNRPVLRLHVKADTIEKRHKNGAAAAVVVPRSTLRNIARDSGVCADYGELCISRGSGVPAAHDFIT